MLIIGAKGFAKEILQILHLQKKLKNLNFYDDITQESMKEIYNFPIITNLEDAKNYFLKVDSSYTIGIGNPILRMEMYRKFNNLGGILVSVISNSSEIGSYNVNIENGVIIMSGVIISNEVRIGIGTMIYYNSILTHDCEVGKFVEISPNATILGHCKIGDYSHIGANATILPKITIGSNVTIGAGSVVTKSIPDNCIVYGNPAIIRKEK
jgi:sugar O-acyltransferase (sialic acid O-acetyltransferase NeuD family)